MVIALGCDVKCIHHILLREIRRQAQMMPLGAFGTLIVRVDYASGFSCFPGGSRPER